MHFNVFQKQYDDMDELKTELSHNISNVYYNKVRKSTGAAWTYKMIENLHTRRCITFWTIANSVHIQQLQIIFIY